VIAVYYDKNRKGEAGYLERDGFKHVKNVNVSVGDVKYTLGVYAAVVNKVKVVFLHNGGLYPSAYPDMGAAMTIRQMAAFSKVIGVVKVRER
jgi:hypothetical protein